MKIYKKIYNLIVNLVPIPLILKYPDILNVWEQTIEEKLLIDKSRKLNRICLECHKLTRKKH